MLMSGPGLGQLGHAAWQRLESRECLKISHLWVPNLSSIQIGHLSQL